MNFLFLLWIFRVDDRASGNGAVAEGVVSLNLGTSGVVFAAVDRPIVEPQGRLHAICHAVPGKWHLMGVMLSAGGSLRWYRDTLAELLDAVAAVSGEPARVGRKKPGSSARFAPGGNAVVWGQTGIGPHAPDERHYIPSIEPFLNVLDHFADCYLDDSGKGSEF